MSKTNKIILILVVLLMICATCLTACDGSTSSVDASCILHKDGIVLPFILGKKRWIPRGTWFECNDTMQEMKQRVEKLTDKKERFTAEIYQDVIFITKMTVADDKMHYFYIAKVKQDNAFELFVAGGTHYNDQEGMGGYYVAPYHMVNLGNYSSGSEFCIETGEEYEFFGSKEDILTFYNNLDAYTVKENENDIVVKLKDDFVGWSEYYTLLREELTIKITEKDGKEYISFNVL